MPEIMKMPSNDNKRAESKKNYRKTDKFKEWNRNYMRTYMREYLKKPERKAYVKAYQKQYYSRTDIKAKRAAYQRLLRARKKQTKEGYSSQQPVMQQSVPQATNTLA